MYRLLRFGVPLVRRNFGKPQHMAVRFAGSYTDIFEQQEPDPDAAEDYLSEDPAASARSDIPEAEMLENAIEYMHGDGKEWDGMIDEAWSSGSDNDPLELFDDDEPSRRPRDPPDPKASRRIEAIRQDPRYKEHGGFLMDIEEHERFVDKQREAFTDGFFFDGTVADYDSETMEDPFANGYLTEDELWFPENYEPTPHVPGHVKDMIYFLYMKRNWSIQQLASKFRMKTARVSVIINLKRTEPEAIAKGQHTEELDALLTEMYASKQHRTPKVDDPDSIDEGVHVMMLTDDQLPEDVVPVRPLRGDHVRMNHELPDLARPEKSKRKYKCKFVVKDISGSSNNKRRLCVRDFDGSIRPNTEREGLYRTWANKHWIVKPNSTGPRDLPLPDDQMDIPKYTEQETKNLQKLGTYVTPIKQEPIVQ